MSQGERHGICDVCRGEIHEYNRPVEYGGPQWEHLHYWRTGHEPVARTGTVAWSADWDQRTARRQGYDNPPAAPEPLTEADFR